MKDKVIVILFVGTLFLFSILGLFFEDKSLSNYERRKLVGVSKLKDDFFENLDDYLSDQFPFRDNFISLNSLFDRYILGNKESNDVYVVDDYIIEKNYPLNLKSVNSFINKLNYINKTYLTKSNVFYTIIPDKNYFIDGNRYLKIDYDLMFDNITNNVNISYIDILPLLKLSDYYKTDIHIKQSSYDKIIKKFSNFFNFDYHNYNFQENIYNKFYGASYSKAPTFIKSEDLIYLSNDILDNANVWHLEYGNKKVYDIEALDSLDSYNVFLSGPSALIEIENLVASNEKELIIFRDSFGSSFAPLLIPYYKKITLIDLRYISADIVNEYVDFNDKDVLFAYSTLIINNSSVLKVNVDE